jgi:hypothetical protein
MSENKKHLGVVNRSAHKLTCYHLMINGIHLLKRSRTGTQRILICRYITTRFYGDKVYEMIKTKHLT